MLKLLWSWPVRHWYFQPRNLNNFSLTVFADKVFSHFLRIFVMFLKLQYRCSESVVNAYDQAFTINERQAPFHYFVAHHKTGLSHIKIWFHPAVEYVFALDRAAFNSSTVFFLVFPMGYFSSKRCMFPKKVPFLVALLVVGQFIAANQARAVSWYLK